MIREGLPALALGDPVLMQILGEHCGEPGGFELADVVISRLLQCNIARPRLAKKQQFISQFTEGRWGTFP